MWRALVIGATISLASVLPISGVFGQQISLKDQIVGNWTFVAVYDQYADGRKRHAFGMNPLGNWIFGADGRFSEILVGEPQKELLTKDPKRPDAFIVSWYGTYVVNEAKKTVTWRAEGGGYSPRFGKPNTITITSITANSLTYAGPVLKDHNGTTFRPYAELQRTIKSD